MDENQKTGDRPSLLDGGSPFGNAHPSSRVPCNRQDSMPVNNRHKLLSDEDKQTVGKLGQLDPIVDTLPGDSPLHTQVLPPH